MLVTIIVDASFCPHNHVGGCGYWIASKRGCLSGGSSFKKQLANSVIAEIYAIANALHSAISKSLVLSGDEVLIQSDCLTAISLYQGNKKEKNQGSEEKQAMLIFNLLKTENDLTIRFRHVKGHSSIKDNRSKSQRMCDMIAKKHMNTLRTKLV